MTTPPGIPPRAWAAMLAVKYMLAAVIVAVAVIWLVAVYAGRVTF